ncbi:tetratricopeptide repeat protein [Flavobacteriales bacterium]|nr:tetratricopeptide repeat protein [Flavobacteriales bacterium]
MKLILQGIVLIGLVLMSQKADAQQDTTKSVLGKGLDQYKLQKAKHLLYNYDYNAALAAYEELYSENPDNLIVQYRIGEIHSKLRDYSAAAKFYGMAVDKNPTIEEDARVNYAAALQRIGEFDKAISQLNKYKQTIKENKVKRAEEIEQMLTGLEYAKKTISDPFDVEVKNMGVDINSTFDDYGASISADEKTIIFTSRRPDTRGGGTDPNDGKYMEDIYISVWSEEENKWSKAEGIKGRLNTEYHDACLSISPDGQNIYVYKNFGESGSGEIYASRLSSSGKWGSPKDMGKLINTSYFESSASITADGQFMYFLSERKGGQGMADIWVAEKLSRSEWNEPVNIGPLVNTALDERMVFVHPEGDILFFASNGHVDKCIGGYDIYMSEKKDGEWQEPINIGSPINSVDDDINFVLSYDSKTAYYSGYKEPTIGGKDIFKVDVSEHALIKEVREKYVTVLGKIADGSANGEPMKVAPKIVLTDVETGNEVKVFKAKAETYSISIERGKKYTLQISAGGFKTQQVELDLTGDDKTPSITQNFVMNR